MRIARTLEIACAPEQLWPFLDEPEKQKLWMKGLLENEQAGPRGVGSTFRLTIREGRKAEEYQGEVTAYDPPRHLAVRLGGGAMKGMSMQVDYRLAPLDGGTRLDYVAEADTACLPWVYKLLMPLVQLFGRFQLRGFLRTLKRLAEEEGRKAAS
jgi:carbon monoxide dehydrogenase subunit G